MPSPNAVTYSSMADWLVAEVLDGNVIALLAERNNLINHPALWSAAPIDARGSNVIKVGHTSLPGYDLLSQAADGATIGLTAVTDGSSTITVNRFTKAYGYTDLARITLANGQLDPSALALDAVVSANSTVTNLICQLLDDFTLTGGPGSGVDLDVASLLAIVGTCAVNNFAGAGMGILHPQQWSDWIVDGGTSIGSASGGTQNYNPELAAMQRLNGDGFVGSWAGIDWFKNNRVVNNGTDCKGAIVTLGSILLGRGEFTGVGLGDPNIVYLGSDPSRGLAGTIQLERSRDAFAGETAFVQSIYVGASVGIQAAIQVVSDAP